MVGGLHLLLAAAVLAAAHPTVVDDTSALTVAWRHAASGWGEPAAVGREIYYLGRGHEIIALDASTGRLRWRVGTGGAGDAPLGSAIRIAGPLVIAPDGGIVAVDRSNGRPVWHFTPTDDAPGPYLGAVAHGRVYAGSMSGRLYALDAVTGQQRWAIRPAGRTSALVYSPAIAGDRVVAAFTSGTDRAVGGVSVLGGTGRRLWRRTLPIGVAATGPAVVVNDVVVVAGSDGTLHAWDVPSGRLRWRAAGVRPSSGPEPLPDIRPLVVAGGLIVAGSTTGRLTAYDHRTGSEVWNYSPAEEVAVLRLHATSSTVFAPYTDDSIRAIDAATGRMRWRVGGVGLRLEWPPAVSEGHVFAAGTDMLVAWRDPDGYQPPLR